MMETIPKTPVGVALRAPTVPLTRNKPITTAATSAAPFTLPTGLAPLLNGAPYRGVRGNGRSAGSGRSLQSAHEQLVQLIDSERLAQDQRMVSGGFLDSRGIRIAAGKDDR